jgi:hypothetical protein
MTVQEHFRAYCKFRGRVAIYAPAVTVQSDKELKKYTELHSSPIGRHIGCVNLYIITYYYEVAI